MSPGATFERVYLEIKRRLVEGELPPGAPIEPAIIGSEIASSITPVRDALHRLTGERLVEAPDHNGFRVPFPTEAELRDMYSWNGQLLSSAVQHIVPAGLATVDISLAQQDIAAASARLFLKLALATGSDEHARAIEQLNDRIAPFRAAEAVLFGDLIDEYGSLLRLRMRADRSGLRRKLTNYHRRRIRVVPDLLAARSRKRL